MFLFLNSWENLPSSWKSLFQILNLLLVFVRRKDTCWASNKLINTHPTTNILPIFFHNVQVLELTDSLHPTTSSSTLPIPFRPTFNEYHIVHRYCTKNHHKPTTPPLGLSGTKHQISVSHSPALPSSVLPPTSIPAWLAPDPLFCHLTPT